MHPLFISALPPGAPFAAHTRGNQRWRQNALPISFSPESNFAGKKRARPDQSKAESEKKRDDTDTRACIDRAIA